MRLIGIGGCLALVLWVTQQFFSVTIVSGLSMEPTMSSGDLLWVDRRAYGQLPPNRGDVLVARFRGERIVKRVVGIPGETVEVQAGVVHIDGVPNEKPHPILPGPMNIGSGRLGQGRYALLGDNRSQFSSTLVHAVVSPSDVVGRVRFRMRIWPPGWGRVEGGAVDDGSGARP